MKQLIRSQRTWVSHGDTWVSLEILGSAMKHLGQPQETWISNKTLDSDSRYLGKFHITCVNHETFLWLLF
jgi:hypothetical protein